MRPSVAVAVNATAPELPSLAAIGICFAMSDVFRSETLGAVMQQIVDQQVLPVLFMRTVSSPL